MHLLDDNHEEGDRVLHKQLRTDVLNHDLRIRKFVVFKEREEVIGQLLILGLFVDGIAHIFDVLVDEIQQLERKSF